MAGIQDIDDLAKKYKETRSDKILAQIIKITKPSVKFFVNRYIYNYDDVEEMISQTYVRVWENIQRYDVSQKFITWIFTITRNECLNFLRFKNKHVYDVETAVKELSCVDNYEFLPTGKELEHEMFECLKRIIAIYTTKSEDNKHECVCFILNYFKNKTTLEISKEMNISENTVKTWIRKTRIEIKKLFTAEYPLLVNYYLEEKGLK